MVFLQFFLLIIFPCLPESWLSLNFTGKCSKDILVCYCSGVLGAYLCFPMKVHWEARGVAWW